MTRGEMEHSFENLRKTNGCQKTAMNVLSLLPGIDNVLDITQSMQIGVESETYLVDQVLDMTQILRNMAADVDLIEPLDTSRRVLGRGNLRVQLSALMQKIDA